jgi:peptide/nickel transport system substrate-binding protein
MRHVTATTRAGGLLAGLAILLAACGAEPATSESGVPASQPGTATGGTVRIATGGSPDSLNPGNGLLAESYDLYELVFDTPIAITPEGEYVPELATSWEVSDDGLTWTLEIVDGVTFHDGTPLTSEDIKYSLELYRDTADFPYMPSYPDVFVDIEAPSPTQLVITTEEPVGNFESRMLFMYVLPKHIWEEQDDPIAFENEEMVGSGPFELASYEQGVSMELDANTDYWNGRPNVDSLIFQTIENPDARVSALTNGDVDMITEFPATAVTTLRNADNVEVYVADSTSGSLTDVFFNVVDPADCPTDDGGLCTGHPALRDLAVRKALALAMDKQQIVDVALLGLGSTGLSLVPPGLGEWYASDVEDYAFDVDAANAMLDEAGYEDTNGDGVRECLADQDCPTGDLTFRFMYPTDSDTGARESELIGDMWAEVGVKVEIQGLEPNTLTSVCCPTFDYDVIRWGWGSDPDPAFLLGVALCDEITTGFSETGYCNPEFDDLYAQQGIETDHDARVDQIHQMQQILMDDVPYIIPYYDQSVQAFRTDTFTGWVTGDRTPGLQDVSSLAVIRPAE